MADDAPKKGSKLGALVPILVLTLAAGGGGALIGKQIVSATRAGADKPAAGAEGAKAAPAAAPAGSERQLKELAPVVTNLAAPEGSWIRLQTAIVYDKNDAPAMELVGRKVSEDILTFVRTLTLEQIQGASGLEALRDDLNERAQLRSDGKVRELLIEMLVVR
jgi:flagellar FliL protein